MGTALTRLGLGAGSRVGVLGANAKEWMISMQVRCRKCVKYTYGSCLYSICAGLCSTAVLHVAAVFHAVVSAGGSSERMH